MRRQADVYLFKTFNKWETNVLKLDHLDEENKQLGGKLNVWTSEWNFSHLNRHSYRQFGYFTDDKLVFGKYRTQENLEEDEGKLMQITQESLNSTDFVLRHNYELVGEKLEYRLEINPNLIEEHYEELSTPNPDHVIRGELVPQIPLTYTERMFYNLS